MDVEFVFWKPKLYRLNAIELVLLIQSFIFLEQFSFKCDKIIQFFLFYFFFRKRALEDKQSTLGIGDTAHISDDLQFDDHEIVPHFQRVSISGEDTSGVPLEDLEHASSLVIQALEMRERYMSLSLQSFPQTTQRFLKAVHNKTMADKVEYEDKRTTAGKISINHALFVQSIYIFLSIIPDI